MRRTGRLGDGWIPSFITPEQFRVGVEKTQAFAAEAGREVPVDHFGALFYCCLDPDPAAARAMAAPFVPRGRIDDAALARCTAFGPPELVRERLEEYVAGGGSKFIVRPMCPPERMLDQLAQLATDVIPASTPLSRARADRRLAAILAPCAWPPRRSCSGSCCAGCSVISIDLSPRIRPLEEETVEGRGDAKILLMDVSGFLSDEAPSGTLTIGTPPPRVPLLVRVREELKKAAARSQGARAGRADQQPGRHRHRVGHHLPRAAGLQARAAACRWWRR